jgi:hypothetical protein
VRSAYCMLVLRTQLNYLPTYLTYRRLYLILHAPLPGIWRPQHTRQLFWPCQAIPQRPIRHLGTYPRARQSQWDLDLRVHNPLTTARKRHRIIAVVMIIIIIIIIILCNNKGVPARNGITCRGFHGPYVWTALGHVAELLR